MKSEALPVIIRLEQLIEETSHKLPSSEKKTLQEKLVQLKANFDKYDVGQIQTDLGDIGGKVRSLSATTDEFKVVSQGWDVLMGNLETLDFKNWQS